MDEAPRDRKQHTVGSVLPSAEEMWFVLKVACLRSRRDASLEKPDNALFGCFKPKRARLMIKMQNTPPRISYDAAQRVRLDHTCQSRIRTLVWAALTLLCVVIASKAPALDLDTPFDSIDGGTMTLSQWEGQPVLVVNTASMCAFTEQYRDLQALYDRYRDQGLVVLAVPSDDFNQELASDGEVKEFCELVYGIDMPMTVITSVKGRNAHPFYQSLRQDTGFAPRWNFNKVLLDGQGNLVETFASRVRPLSDEITTPIEDLLAKRAG